MRAPFAPADDADLDRALAVGGRNHQRATAVANSMKSFRLPGCIAQISVSSTLISISLNRIADAKLKSGDLQAALAAAEESLAVGGRKVPPPCARTFFL